MKIVEVCGIPSAGKSLLTKQLASRFNGVFIDLPNLRMDSYTGAILIEEMKSGRLISSPDWWSLIAAANMFECLPLIRKSDLVFISNYKTGFSALFKGVLGLQNAREVIKSLPEPNVTYCVLGKKILRGSSIEVLNPFQEDKLKKYFESNFFSPRYKKINNLSKDFNSSSPTYTLNLMLDYITDELVNIGYIQVHSNQISNLNNILTKT